MKRSSILIASIIIVFLLNIIVINYSYANNLNISSVSLGNRNLSNDTVVVSFDVQWENSWKTKINHDAVWLTVRLYNPSFSPTEKKLCQIASNGLNPIGTSVGNGAKLDFFVPSDKNGAFLRSEEYGNYDSISSTDVQLTIDYSTCGFTSSDNVYASVLGVEMVLVPEGAFYAGDKASVAALNQGSSDTDPWSISSSAVIGTSDPVSNGFRYVSAGNVGENATGSVFTIPAALPKGYGGFYAMKYEITEGQWVEFLNALGSSDARVDRDITDNNHKNSDTAIKRNTISCSGSPLACSTQRPSRAVSYLTWMDVAAFLDWAALRPMTELEYEKMSRGPLLSVEGEYAWGTAEITGVTIISGTIEDGTETVDNQGANAHYDNATLVGGDALNGAEYTQGPLRGGILATSITDREASGAGYYGVLELSGNLRERVVTIGNASGRNYLGTHGDGVLTVISGFEGNATNSDWPGIDADISRGITGAQGSGFKGGGWDSQLTGARLRVSDRQDAANSSTLSFSNAGGRGARTYEE